MLLNSMELIKMKEMEELIKKMGSVVFMMCYSKKHGKRIFDYPQIEH